MTEQQLSVRVGSYTLEDVPSLVPVHLEAFHDYPNGRLGPGYAAAALAFYCRFPGAIALAGWLGEHLVGYVCGVDYDREAALGRAVRWAGIRAVISRPWLALDPAIRAKLTTRLLEGLGRSPAAAPSGAAEWPRPVMGLVAIGVDLAARGKGVGGALLDAFEEQCRNQGVASMLLSVYSDNSAARQLYERKNWQQAARCSRGREAIYYLKKLTPE